MKLIFINILYKMQEELISYLSTILPLVLIPWILLYVYWRYKNDKKLEKDKKIEE
jgi:hypothetical protein